MNNLRFPHFSGLPRRPLLTTLALAALSSALFLPACVATDPATGDPSDEDDAAGEATGEAEESIVRAATQTSFAGIVRLDLADGSCTATILSEHWLLTAAHCLKSLPSISTASVRVSMSSDGLPDTPAETVYTGPIQRFTHPSYTSGARAYDVGLVHLRSYGINTTTPGRGEIYTGPGFAASSSMVIAGFGKGTSPGGSSSCGSGTSGALRSRAQTLTGGNPAGTVAWTDDMLHCAGDSGGPWMNAIYAGNKFHYLQFAVHGGYEWDLIDGWFDLAATISTTRSWIESTMAANPPYRFWLTSSPATANGTPYVTYNEAGFILAPLKIQGWCVEPVSNDNLGRLALRTCNGSANQTWWLKATGEIVHPVSGKCMDLKAGDTTNGVPLQLWDCYGGLTERYRHTSDGAIHYGGDYNKCVDLPWNDAHDGAELWIYDCNGSGAQAFGFN